MDKSWLVLLEVINKAPYFHIFHKLFTLQAFCFPNCFGSFIPKQRKVAKVIRWFGCGFNESELGSKPTAIVMTSSAHPGH